MRTEQNNNTRAIPSNPKQDRFNIENQIMEKKREKETLEKEYYKLTKRNIRKKVNLQRKVQVEEELSLIERNIGQMKNKLRLMKLEFK